MAGGKGTRFWPESTSKRPKQYLSISGEDSLLTQTLKRFNGLSKSGDSYVVTVSEQGKLAIAASDILIPKENVFYEPEGRNTAPCILLAVAKLLAEGRLDSDILAIVPSDHIILNEKGFRETLDIAYEHASTTSQMVTIGIKPNFPHTGYGYIKRGQKNKEGFDVLEFKEKPNFETAKKYVESGEFYWNGGIFVTGLGTLIKEFKTHSPETFSFLEELKININNPEKLKEIYSQIPANSIDYAIMEKSKNIAVVEANFDWNDLGSWEALENVIDQKDGNTITRESGHYFQNASGNIVYAPNKFVGLININDLIIVSNEHSLMVLPKKDSQEVKKIVQYLSTNPSKNLQELS